MKQATLRCTRCGTWIAKTEYRGVVVKVNRGVAYQSIDGERSGLRPVWAKRPGPPNFAPAMVECPCESTEGTIYIFDGAWAAVPFGAWEKFVHGDGDPAL